MKIGAGMLAIAVATGCAQARSSVSESVSRTVNIAGSSLRTHMAVLSDDSLEGRLTGSPGYAKAARYVASEFRKANLQPGSAGDWFQNVPLRRRDLHPDSTRIILASASLGAKQQFALDYDFVATYPGMRSAHIESAIVFVGQGITVPGRHDDYSDVDAKGKIVAYVPGTPATLTRDERAFYESTKLRNAAAHGAIAALRIWTPEEERTGTWHDAVAEYRDAHVFDFVLDLPTTETELPPAFESLWLGPEASRLILGASGDRGRVGVTARIDAAGELTKTYSPNVIGLLRGSDRKLRNEFVVVSAHLDHLGIGRQVSGDSIYNGTVDNASGVAALIELARAFATAQNKPRRSILFVAFTGEEPGSLGAEYFVRHPPVAFDRIAANINIDGISMWPFDGLVPRGAEHSTLAAIIKESAARRAVTFSPDPTPDRYSVAGSDQYSFMTHEIPAVIFASARSGAARQAALDWVRARYHKPSDDMNQPLDFGAGARFTEELYWLIAGIADAPAKPRWISGDFFERAH